MAITFSYAIVWGVMAAALTRATNLTAAGLREAVLSLNHQTSIGGPLLFSNVTGVNISPSPPPLQIDIGGVLADGNSPLVYPFDWPWRLVVAGDPITSSQSASSILIALVVTVLGAWVAQIIIEQAIFSRRHGSRLYVLWLAVVALSLGGVGVWCSMLMQSTALTTAVPGFTAQPVAWSLRALLLALLPSLLLTFAGLCVYMSDIDVLQETSDRTPAAITARTLQEKKRVSMQQAALSHREHLLHLLRAVSWRTAVGGLLVVSAVVLTRVTLWQVWEQPATFQPMAWAWLVSLLLDALLIPTALLMLFHALRRRVPAVFMFTAAVVGDWQLHVTSMRWTYSPQHVIVLDLGSPSLGSEAVLLVAGLIAALICFVFIGLQFHAMKLSRNDLTVLVVSLKAAVRALRLKVADDSRQLAQQQQGAKVLATAINAVNLLSALPQDYSLALVLHSGLSEILPAAPPRDLSKASHRKPSAHGAIRATRSHSKNSVTSASTDDESEAQPASERPQDWRGRDTAAVAPATIVTDMEPQKAGSERPTVSSHNQRSTAAVSQQGFARAVQASLEMQAQHILARSSVVHAEEVKRIQRGSVSSTAGDDDEASFLLTAPLLAALRDEKVVSPPTPPPLPSLEAIIAHSVAVELFKQELRKTQSVESLVFCLHVRWYRALPSAAARKLLAVRMADTFIRQNAPQQINIDTRQRQVILAAISKKDDACSSPSLFSEAEAECMMLMRSNAWNAFTVTGAYRLCAWLCHHIVVEEAVAALSTPPSTVEIAVDTSWLNARDGESEGGKTAQASDIGNEGVDAGPLAQPPAGGADQ